MVAYNAGGTEPENTSVSVPRLTPEYNVRTRTSSGLGGARVTGRISPWPGRPTQKARASSDMTILSNERLTRRLNQTDPNPVFTSGGLRQPYAAVRSVPTRHTASTANGPEKDPTREDPEDRRPAGGTVTVSEQHVVEPTIDGPSIGLVGQFVIFAGLATSVGLGSGGSLGGAGGAG